MEYLDITCIDFSIYTLNFLYTQYFFKKKNYNL
jgi:hypothetical protein